MKFLRPKDLIAALTIVMFSWLRIKGIDGNFDTVIALILGYYFVKRQNGKDNGK